MDDQIERHQPLITARLVFAPKAFPPPPIIAARMEFPFISVPQQHERSPTPEIRTLRKYSLTPKRQHPTSKIASTSNRSSTPRCHTNLQTPPRPATTPTRPVAFEDYVDPGSPLTNLPDEDELESEEDGEVSNKILKLPGSAGRPQSGGYNLQDKLTWNDITYESIMALTHKLAKTKLDTAKSFRGQDMKKIKQICDAVSKEYPILKDYVRDWPTRDMLKLHLKYTSEAARRSAVASTAKTIEKALSKAK